VFVLPVTICLLHYFKDRWDIAVYVTYWSNDCKQGRPTCDSPGCVMPPCGHICKL